MALMEAELKQRETERIEELARKEAKQKERMAIEEKRLEFEKLKWEKCKSDEKLLINRMKKFSESIKGLLPVMPTNSAELPTFFDSVEHVFKSAQVDDDLCGKLLLPLLSGKAKSVIGKLSAKELDDYHVIKATLLREFHITPRELYSRFDTATKRNDESYTVFRSRLECNLRHYVQSRNINDFAKLFDLIIADKLKERLAPSALNYVLALEGNKCFTSNDIASNADIYASNYFDDGAYKASHVSNFSLRGNGNHNRGRGRYSGFQRPVKVEPDTAVNAQGTKASVNSVQPTTVQPTIKSTVYNNSRGGKTGEVKGPKLCYICKSDKHIQAHCPKQRLGREFTDVKSASVKSCVPDDTANATATCNLISCSPHVINELCHVPCIQQVNCHVVDDTVDCSVTYSEPEYESMYELAACNQQDDYSSCGGPTCSKQDGGAIYDGDASKGGQLTCNQGVQAIDVCSASISAPDIELTPLKYVDVMINGNVYKALSDSGAQIPLIRSSLLSSDISYVGNINLKPAVGNIIPAKLTVLDVAKYDESAEPSDPGETQAPLHLTFAVSDVATSDVVLPRSIAKRLKSTSHKCKQFCVNVNQLSTCALSCDDDYVNISHCDSDSFVNCNDSVNIVAVNVANLIVDMDINCDQSVNACDCEHELDNNSLSVRERLIEEQMSDSSLKNGRSQADIGRGNYLWQDGILYHKDKVLNQEVLQICVPQSRRKGVIELAHDKSFHQGSKKTSERIRYTFYWPSLKSDVIHHVTSCIQCQQKRRIMVKERVPIAPIERACLPGEHLMMDVIGPIDPPSAQGHKYLLNIICMNTKWPFAYLLKNIGAKSICGCLCDVFSHLGIAHTISSDCGSNFVSKLTQEFLECMGCSPKFTSPVHHEAVGAVERLNQSFKRMLHHAITKNVRQWHKCVPFILWALRESGNESTGLPPYTMLYGHQPRGPLHLLKENWTGDKPLPNNFNKSEIEYMTSLKKQLDIVRSYADSHTENSQDNYVDNYNKRSTDKSFSVGETVIVLEGDSTNKLLSKWQVGTIDSIISDYSYRVKMSNGSIMERHANALRPFVARIDSVIAEQDSDCGDVLPVPPGIDDCLPSKRINRDKLAHLKSEQQNELLTLLDEFHVCFSDKPGLLKNVEHEITTLPGFVPKRHKPYRIPEMLKPEVERQIEVLLQDGFIVPSSSPMISPIVCVIKHGTFKAGSMQVRIVCDYRYLNKYTQFDPFPVPDQEEVLNKLASFNYISLFDAKAGYWQTEIKPSCRWLFGFATHHGLWEWTRTPFGARNSGSTFIRGIQDILRPIKDISASYVDDMGTGSNSWPDHLNNLRKFFVVIKDAGVTLNLAKSEFGKSQVTFVGYLIGSGSKAADPDKLASLKLIKKPTNQKQLKSYLGMVSYHRSLIHHFAELAKPLYDLTKPKYAKCFLWNDEHDIAFDRLQQALSETVKLSVPRIGGLFILRTDASIHSISGCLYQRIDDDLSKVGVKGEVEYPISFFSRKLTATQSRWSVIEREAYAVVESLNKFNNLIFWSPIVIYCDHNPLSYLINNVTNSPKLTRWNLALQCYNTVFRYTKGCDNSVADYYSRYIE